MNRISAWLYKFMQGRYGFDQLGQALSVGVVVMWIFSILCGVLANHAASCVDRMAVDHSQLGRAHLARPHALSHAVA